MKFRTIGSEGLPSRHFVAQRVKGGLSLARTDYGWDRMDTDVSPALLRSLLRKHKGVRFMYWTPVYLKKSFRLGCQRIPYSTVEALLAFCKTRIR